MSSQSGPSEHDQTEPVVKADSDQTEHPQTEVPSSQTQKPVQSESPLTGQSKAEKTLDYLRRLRSRGEFDPSAQLSNEQADAIAKRVSELTHEEVSSSTVKDARKRLLKEPVKRALQEPQATKGSAKGGEASHPQPKRPTEEPGPAPSPATAPEKPPKPPLTPEQDERNRKFWHGLTDFIEKLSESHPPSEVRELLVDGLTEWMNELRLALPGWLKVAFGLPMYAYYILDGLRKKLQRKKEEQVKEAEKK